MVRRVKNGDCIFIQLSASRQALSGTIDGMSKFVTPHSLHARRSISFIRARVISMPMKTCGFFRDSQAKSFGPETKVEDCLVDIFDSVAVQPAVFGQCSFRQAIKKHPKVLFYFMP
jgi:hypothetical protein